MTDQIEKKKMSKGCMIGLIVGGVAVLMLVAMFASCYFYKDDIMRYGVTKLIESLKIKVDTGEVDGVNAERFAQMTDAFKVKLKAEPLDYTKFQRFGQTIQAMATNENIDKDDISNLMDAMVEYFPELEDFNLPEESADSTMAEDSTAVIDSAAVE